MMALFETNLAGMRVLPFLGYSLFAVVVVRLLLELDDVVVDERELLRTLPRWLRAWLRALLVSLWVFSRITSLSRTRSGYEWNSSFP
jgi:hypothetical protein